MRVDRRQRAAHRAFLRFRETGEPEAIARVFDLVAPRLHALAAQLVRDESTGDDLVQATFLDAIQKADRFDAARPLMPWLMGILVHHASHEFRRARRAMRAPSAPPEADASPDEAAMAREFAEHLAASLDRLPPIYRQVVRLRLEEGLHPTQIAQRLRRPRETVKTQLARGLSRLRRELPRGAPALVGFGAPGRAGLESVRETVCEFARSSAPTPSGAAAAKPVATGWLVVPVLVVAVGTWLVVASTGEEHAPEGPTAAVSEGHRASGDLDRVAADGAHRAAARAEQPAGPAAVDVRWAEGGAAAGVTVLLRPEPDRSWLREQRMVTDASGTARFAPSELAAAERWRLRADREAAWRVVTRGDLALGVTIELPLALDVEGTVLDGAGRPLAGARVWHVHHGVAVDEGAPVAVSDAAGRYSVRGIPAGSALGALADGWEPAAFVSLHEATSQLTLRCGKRAPTIAGTVLGVDGAPVRDAAVMVGWSLPVGLPVGLEVLGPPTCLRTGADGRFVCRDQLAGEVPIWVGAPGAAAQRVTASVSGGETADLTLRLDAGTRVRGRVLRRDGTPVPGASIELRQLGFEPPDGYEFDGPTWGRVAATTDRDGCFATEPVAPGDTTLCVVGPDGVRTRSTRELTAGTEIGWDVMLGFSTTLEGRLEDPSGDPLTGWTLWLEAEPGRVVSERVETATDGTFAVPRCESERRFLVRLVQPGLGNRPHTITREVVAAGRPAVLRLLPHEIARAAARAIITDPTGRPLAAPVAQVRRIEAGTGSVYMSSVRARVDSGVAVFGPLLVGRYVLDLYDSEYGIRELGAFEIREPEERVDLGTHRLEPPAHLVVRVRGADGVPLRNASIGLCPEGSSLPLGLTMEGGVGQARLQPGKYLLSYVGGQGVPRAQEVELGAAESRTVDWQLEPGVRRRILQTGVSGDHQLVSFDWFHSRDGLVAREVLVVHQHDERPMFPLLAIGDYRVVCRDALGRESVTEWSVTATPPDSPIELRMP